MEDYYGLTRCEDIDYLTKPFVIVDMDTGTILGTNVRIVRDSFFNGDESDEETRMIAKDFGRPVFAFIPS